MDHAIELRDVRKTFGRTVAVDGLDLIVPAGAIYGLLGPNGAGKTTTIRIMLDILGPDRGEVRVLGRRVDDDVRKRVGYLPEERGLYPKMSVLDHLVFLAELKRMRRDQAREEAERWLGRLDLGEWADNDVEELSKGMQQKVQFISTILHDPDLLILDEPFSGLDPINVNLLKEIVLEKSRDGTTVLFSTHMIEDAERICDRVCMIAHARKVLDGTVADVKASAGRRHVAMAFDGDRSFLDAPGLIEKASDHGRYVEITLADGADPQELLRRAMRADARIERFELLDPSLREIFLERAGRKGIELEGREPAGVAARPTAVAES